MKIWLLALGCFALSDVLSVRGDDGKLIAFQMAKSREAAGVGHGLFLYDVEKAQAR